MSACAGPGCDRELTRVLRGRTAEYCSPACRQRASRARRREDLALQITELIRSTDDTRLFEALLALDRPTALALRNRLLRAERRVS